MLLSKLILLEGDEAHTRIFWNITFCLLGKMDRKKCPVLNKRHWNKSVPISYLGENNLDTYNPNIQHVRVDLYMYVHIEHSYSFMSYNNIWLDLASPILMSHILFHKHKGRSETETKFPKWLNRIWKMPGTMFSYYKILACNVNWG